MLRTPICDLLDIEVPIMQAAIWPATAPELVAAVSEAGGLGSIGSVFESAKSVERQIERVRELRNGPSRLTRWCRYSTNMPSKPPSKPNRQWCLWPSAIRATSSSRLTPPGQRSSTRSIHWDKPVGSRNWA